MIKILERRFAKVPSKRTNCTYYTSTLEVPKDDCTDQSDRDGDMWKYTCPACSTFNFIYSWDKEVK